MLVLPRALASMVLIASAMTVGCAGPSMKLADTSLEQALGEPTARPRPFPTAVSRSPATSSASGAAFPASDASAVAPTVVSADPKVAGTQNSELPLPIEERFRPQRAAAPREDLAHRIANPTMAAAMTQQPELAPQQVDAQVAAMQQHTRQMMQDQMLSASMPAAQSTGMPYQPLDVNVPANSMAPAAPQAAAAPTPTESQPAPNVAANVQQVKHENVAPADATPAGNVVPASASSKIEAPADANANSKAPPPIGKPAPAATDEKVHQQLDDLIASLESQVRAARDKGDKALAASIEQKLSLVYLLADREDDAVRAPQELPVAEQEAYRHLMFGLTTWLADDESRRVGHRNAKVLHSLRQTSQQLAAVSRLELRNVTFCERVDYFGWYQAFTRNEFKPRQQVILYVEVDNHASELRGKDQYETRLQGSYQIYDASGAVVAERQLPLDQEVCRNHRRDYFLAYRIYMPETIAEGTYRLELTVEDQQGKAHFKGIKLGEASIEFSIRN